MRIPGLLMPLGQQYQNQSVMGQGTGQRGRPATGSQNEQVPVQPAPAPLASQVAKVQTKGFNNTPASSAGSSTAGATKSSNAKCKTKKYRASHSSKDASHFVRSDSAKRGNDMGSAGSNMDSSSNNAMPLTGPMSMSTTNFGNISGAMGSMMPNNIGTMLGKMAASLHSQNASLHSKNASQIHKHLFCERSKKH